MREKDLKTSQDQFEGLWERVDVTRSTSKTVKVDKDALMQLLMDHSAMVDELSPHNSMNLRSE